MKSTKIFETMLSHIRESISSDTFLNSFKEDKCFIRKRLLSMYQVIHYLIYSNRSSMSINLGNLQDDLPELHFPDVSRQAVSKARQKIKPELFQKLFESTVTDYYSLKKDFVLWNGYHLFAIDGSDIHMAKSDSVIEDFGEHSDPRYPQRHNMGLASILYDVSQDMIVDAELLHCRTGERTPARRHLDRLKEMNITSKLLIIFDRGYYSGEMFDFITDMGFSCLMRIRESNTSLTSCASDDALCQIKRAKNTIRVVRVKLDSGEDEYLVTNIMDEAITPDMLKDLYHKRWKVETKYFELKEQWGLEHFNGATSRSVQQEFWIFLMKSNLCNVIKNEADRQIKEKQPNYCSCRAYLIGRLHKLLPRYLLGAKLVTSVNKLFHDALRNKSLIRDGRHFKRKMPRNHKVNCKNRKTTT